MRMARSFASLPVQVNITWRALGQGAEQTLGVGQHAFVQVARMGIEGAGLARDGLHHVRMAVPDRSDVVVGIQIALAVGVVQPDAIAATRCSGLS
jgi:hypothetical protein